jgi:hypothetical protein
VVADAADVAATVVVVAAVAVIKMRAC